MSTASAPSSNLIPWHTEEFGEIALKLDTFNFCASGMVNNPNPDQGSSTELGERSLTIEATKSASSAGK